MKKYKLYTTTKGENHFVIEEDLPDVGWYLRIYDNQNNCVADYLQDTFKDVMDFASEEFEIDNSNWKEIINK